MAQSHKQLERSLKGPDRFQASAARALDWLAQNPLYVWSVLGPMLLIAVGWAGWSYWTRQATLDRQEELGKVEAVYQDELRVVSDKVEALRKQQDEIDINLGKEKDAKKKDELTSQRKALDTQAAALKPDHSGSLKGLVEFFNKYPNRPEGWAAGLRAAAIQVDQKDFATAKETLTKLINESRSQNFFQVQSRFMLIGVHEELGDLKAALTEASSLEAKVDDRMKPQTLLTKARLQLALEQREEADKTLNTLLEKFAASQEADKARSIKALYIGG
jgi:predicted negative regulator of RcsB-dependent stress response